VTTLHVMRETNLLNVPATLREIADSIDEGRFGEPVGCVVVLDAATLEVFYMGQGEAAPNTVLLMNAAIGKMVAPVLEEKT
jgi:hypothetical protein